jgi:hypothetical protein
MEAGPTIGLGRFGARPDVLEGVALPDRVGCECECSEAQREQRTRGFAQTLAKLLYALRDGRIRLPVADIEVHVERRGRLKT